jgi:hypothetical protein
MIKLINPGLARIGKIVIGEKGPNHPVKFDHFVVKTLFRDQKGQLIVDQALMERLGEKPTSLRIRLPFNDVEMNFPNSLRFYKGARLYCTGDGETAERLGGQGPTYGPAEAYGPCGEACKDFKERRCRPFGMLRCVLEEQQQIGGIYEWRTTSYNSIRNVLAALTMIKAQTGGQLAWVPLTMRLVPQTVTPREGSPNTAYIVQIVYEGSPQHLLTTVRDLLALRAPLMEEIRSLEAGLRALPPAPEDPDDAKDTQEEFFPDNGEEHPATAQASTTASPKEAPEAIPQCAAFDPQRGWCIGPAGHAGAYVFGNSPVVVAPLIKSGTPDVSDETASHLQAAVESHARGSVANPPAGEAGPVDPPAAAATSSPSTGSASSSAPAEPPKATKPPATDELPKSRGSLEAAAGSLLKAMAPGDTPEARAKRVELMQRCWQKKGWLELTALPLSKFKAGLVALQALSRETPAAPSAEDDVPDFAPPAGQNDLKVDGPGSTETPTETPEIVNGYVGRPGRRRDFAPVVRDGGAGRGLGGHLEGGGDE